MHRFAGFRVPGKSLGELAKAVQGINVRGLPKAVHGCHVKQY